MPKPTPLTDQVVTVCFAPGEDADWFSASEKVNDLLNANGTPARRYHVRHRSLIGWLTRFFGYYLLDAARKFGAITMAAGGRKGRLDLNATAANAAGDAILRWRAWNQHINNTTKPARTWEDFLAQHHADPAKVSINEARRRFQQQPRVLAMLAYVGAHTFDPYELAAYQAGEATYAGLHWRIAMVGDVLITVEGKVLKPASDTVADQLRFGNEACAYLRSLKSSARLCAVAIA
ncbi:hypothetical protein [Catellatospora citrea]|uniref:Uncharacterized protein n=1 Tax=Catellatospora citrea TaxID=53366 RepID=A0A8J3KL65_9ACTN|nr:hypothetical protein [Catellatospora citrea]RKE07935.1 hypothetical protein C8E86_2775 [Catellatospora citrea]GIG02053.1 hypothetical protein Cci01nite_71460 [Catellatospora citrea]